MALEGNVDTMPNDHGDDSCLSLAINIDNLFKTRVPRLTPDCCIYRVVKNLRDLNNAAYTPVLVSIGPFHHGKHGLEFMERIKESYLFEFVNRSNLSLKDLLAFTKDSEPRIRRCYAEPIELQDETFLKMVLLDASFVIEHFIRTVYRTINDGVFFPEKFHDEITDDLGLLENQLPFWFLAKLYDLAFGSNDNYMPFLYLSYRFFTYYNRQNLSPKADDHVSHFTDLIRTFYLPSVPREEPIHTGGHKQFSCGAEDLRAAGVHFKGINSSSTCLFDIKFNAKNGELSFPNFEVEDRTESVFRNLMAFEQYHYLDSTYICDYIVIVEKLINTSNDVDILTQNGCISNCLGGQDELAALFNSLGRDIQHSRDESYFCKVAQELGDYYDKPWHNYKATLKQDYFGTPWKFASTVAAIILLILTLIQTVNSFKPL